MKSSGSMLSSGDVVELDLGTPTGREAGFRHPAVVVTAQRILDAAPNVIHVVPLTTTIRRFGSEVLIEPDEANGLRHPSAAQCQHVRAVSTGRVLRTRGNVGPVSLTQIRDTIGLILDIPG
jgi:mRNA interferase MazF